MKQYIADAFTDKIFGGNPAAVYLLDKWPHDSLLLSVAWAEKLKKETLVAYQASERGGVLYCRYEKDRIKIAGKAALYSVGEIFLPPDEGTNAP